MWFLILSLISSACSGCAILWPEYSAQVDQAKLMNLYRSCIEKHYGDPEAIQKNCEPIVAPLRIRGLERR